MRSIVNWAIHNSPAMNTILIASLIVGSISMLMMRREVFPEFELEIVLVSVPYPGASPQEVEEGICQKIEEAVQSIDGINKQTAVAQEGAGFLILELEPDIKDVQKVLNEVRSEIDQIPSFPELAEDPDVQQITFRMPAIQVGVIGPDADSHDARVKLRELAEEVRTELLQQPEAKPRSVIRRALSFNPTGAVKTGITSADIISVPNYQIDVELSEDTLREYGLSLRQVAQIIRQENLELPGGNLKTAGQEMLLRGKAKRTTGAEIEEIQVLAKADGDILTLSDLGRVIDGFEDTSSINEVDGLPAMVISVERTSTEDLFTVVDTVYDYVDQKEMPPGYELVTWSDQSIDVQDRMSMLMRNGIGGLILVFLVLAIFLDLRLAFWVALGIPVAVLGSGFVLLYMGQTLNMLSMFAFLMALGIVVDDAIVIGENIYEHRQYGKGFVRAALDGTMEVLPSVIASVTTTIVAFSPLLFVAGIMGKFIAVMPIAVIAMLVISLVESTFILPCHLAHENNLFMRFLGLLFYPFKAVGALFHWLNEQATQGLHLVIHRLYLPSLKFSLAHKPTVFASAIAIVMLSAGLVSSGLTPFVLFPKLDSRIVIVSVVFPDGTPEEFADRATQRIENIVHDINRDEIDEHGKPFLKTLYRNVGTQTDADAAGPSGTTSGGHVGSVELALYPVEERSITSAEIVAKLRERVGEIPGAESVGYSEGSFGPGGTPIEFKLLTDKEHFAELEEVVEISKAKLREYQGVQDIEDDSRPGKWELQIRLKDDAKALGVTLDDVARTVRAAFYGEEVMRLQRGRHEVKLMVRYPEDERRSIDDFENIRVRADDGSERPVTELAEVEFERGYSEINRVDQLRSITISADIDESEGNAREIVADLQANFFPELLAAHPDIYVRWEGQQQQSTESISSLFFNLVIALLVMFVLLTIEFRSYLQPAIIMAIIPFGAIGAIIGHLVMGLEVTLFSLFGLVALTGVVVNDSIVLIDFINKRRGTMPLREALLEAGRRRFRPVLLTSMTTIAGLIPMLLETSFQAQILIPMATSLCFGLLFATLLILILVPVFYDVYASVVGIPPNDDEDGTSVEPVAAATEPPREFPSLERPRDILGEPVGSAD